MVQGTFILALTWWTELNNVKTLHTITHEILLTGPLVESPQIGFSFLVNGRMGTFKVYT